MYRYSNIHILVVVFVLEVTSNDIVLFDYTLSQAHVAPCVEYLISYNPQSLDFAIMGIVLCCSIIVEYEY